MRQNCQHDINWHNIFQSHSTRARRELVRTRPCLCVLSWQHLTWLFKAYIQFSLGWEQRRVEALGGKRSCRGGDVRKEVTLITCPHIRSDVASISTLEHTSMSSWLKGNVNIQESIFGRIWGVSLEVVGEGWMWDGGVAATKCQRQNVARMKKPMWELDAPEG